MTFIWPALKKSGAFVEHAQEIAAKMPAGKVLISLTITYTDNLAGQADPSAPYGRTTNYGHKIIFKTSGDKCMLFQYRRAISNPTPRKVIL